MAVTSSGSGYHAYLDRAEECQRKAELAISPLARVRYLDSADRWIALANSYVEAPSLAPEANAESVAMSGKPRR
jgi:hypothetical protein